jgi:aspartate aminotransferase
LHYQHARAAVEPKLKDRVLTVNGVSKAFSMTGWRIGYAGGPQWLVDAMQILQSQSTSNPCSISQMAAIAALEKRRGFIQDWLRILEKRRDRVLQMIDKVDGLSSRSPEGAFYIFADCSGLFGKSTTSGKRLEHDIDVADFLLDAAHVGTLHGSAFGAPGFLRIAYAIDNTILEDACTRIEKACATLAPADASVSA